MSRDIADDITHINSTLYPGTNDSAQFTHLFTVPPTPRKGTHLSGDCPPCGVILLSAIAPPPSPQPPPSGVCLPSRRITSETGVDSSRALQCEGQINSEGTGGLSSTDAGICSATCSSARWLSSTVVVFLMLCGVPPLLRGSTDTVSSW